MSDISEAEPGTLSLRNNITLSLPEPISLLGDVLSHFSLQATAAEDGDIDELWQCIQEVKATPARDNTTQTKVKDKEAFQRFLSHCYVRRQYHFSIKKCGAHD